MTPDVNRADQPETIRSMFGDIASRYDWANTVLSFGIHHLWRKTLVRHSAPNANMLRGMRVLDCATGTGDLAFEWERAVGTSGEVIGTDFCEEMLNQARVKASERASRVRFQGADALALPFADSEFDRVSIAFGIRNVQSPLRALSELGRVTRPGGRVEVLEFGQSQLPVWGKTFEFYSKQVLPKIGGLITGKRDAYEYLQSSSAAFPSGDQFLELARESGRFNSVRYRALSGGVAYIYSLEVSA